MAWASSETWICWQRLLAHTGCETSWTRCGVAEGTVDNTTRERERALHETGRYVRALGARLSEQQLTDTFQFLSGLGAVPIMILYLNVFPHLSLAVRSAFDVGGWTDCAAVVAEASAKEPPSTCFVHAGPGSRIGAVPTYDSLCDVGLVVPSA